MNTLPSVPTPEYQTVYNTVGIALSNKIDEVPQWPESERAPEALRCLNSYSRMTPPELQAVGYNRAAGLIAYVAVDQHQPLFDEVLKKMATLSSEMHPQIVQALACSVIPGGFDRSEQAFTTLRNNLSTLAGHLNALPGHVDKNAAASVVKQLQDAVG